MSRLCGCVLAGVLVACDGGSGGGAGAPATDASNAGDSADLRPVLPSAEPVGPEGAAAEGATGPAIAPAVDLPPGSQGPTGSSDANEMDPPPVTTEPGVVADLPEPGDPLTQPAVTWHDTIAPLVIGKCSGCHRSEGIAPFSLTDYEQTQTLAPLLQAAIDLRLMPPWGAHDTDECQPRFGFRDDLRLSDEEIAAFGEWVASGTPEGDPATAVPVGAPPSLELLDATASLVLPEVDVTGTSDRFLCFSLDPGFTEDAWVVASQVVPGNAAVVHHVLSFVDTAGESAALVDERGYYDCFGGPQVSDVTLLSAWAPGSVAWRTPDGVAMSVPAGSRIVVNVHYHPTGAETDLDLGTRLDLALSPTEPAYEGQMILLGNFDGPGPLGELLPGEGDPPSGVAFTIPAGAAAHVEQMRFDVPPLVPEAIVWGVGTHMHYVGTDMQIRVTRPSSTVGQPVDECLLQTPRWDFNWQRGYQYDAPLTELPTVRTGDTLHFRCTYDNSLSNPFVRDALDAAGLAEPHDVVLGEETLDEMCLGVFAVAYPR